MINSSSQAYKKARRQYLKSTKSRDSNADWSAFRISEKHFKSKFPPPDFTFVLDLATLDDARAAEVAAGVWAGSPDVVPTRQLASSKAYVLPSIPGLVLLPAFLTPERQRELVKWSLVEHCRPPNETNLDTHYLLPDQGLWNAFLQERSALVHPRPIDVNAEYIKQEPGPRQLVDNIPASRINFESIHSISKPLLLPSVSAQPSTSANLLPRLRWANIGWFYHWGTKHYDFSKGKIPVHETVRQVCKEIIKLIDWNEVFESDTSEWGPSGPDWVDWHDSYEPDAGIVNFYQTKDTLMAHVDRSEVCATSPLVSISLGNSAVFLIGGPTRDTKPLPILLRSGDVVIMSGPACRRSYHGIPRILENTLPSYMKEMTDDGWAPFRAYMESTRININVRQVFPKGFTPALA
ncbi:hypothetical protein D9757_002030 [Collybiopsis confluens]|uniref:Fe2OG dioxygenase domain-containing protein n=1 Tax=Collybiopsis confluens TaxID=2823264 RepID=A0A8H5HXZ1_9AGAR|nr:hypothetical protein D9757_002030 [Collybiopsis confluens]